MKMWFDTKSIHKKSHKNTLQFYLIHRRTAACSLKITPMILFQCISAGTQHVRWTWNCVSKNSDDIFSPTLDWYCKKFIMRSYYRAPRRDLNRLLSKPIQTERCFDMRSKWSIDCVSYPLCANKERLHNIPSHIIIPQWACMNHVNEYYRYSPLKIALHYAIRHHPCMPCNNGISRIKQ